MKKFVISFMIFLFCTSCGVKDDPEYKSQIKYNKIIQLV